MSIGLPPRIAFWRRGASVPAPSASSPVDSPLRLPDGTGYRLSLGDAAPDAYTALLRSNGGQEADWRLCMALLRPGDVFLDLGANVGVFSIPAAVLGAEVHAFELLAANARRLADAAELNGLHGLRVTLGAVWDRGGAVGFSGSSAWGTVNPLVTTYAATVRVDDYVAQHLVGPVGLMKIDVEGSERNALWGAAATVARDGPDILVESNSLTCGGAGYSYREVLRLLSGWGYALHRVGDGVLHPWTADAVQEVVQTDYLATRRTPEALAARSGWPVRPMTADEVLHSVLGQDLHNDYHRMHLLAVGDRLPAAVRQEARVAALFDRWRALEGNDAMAALRVGTA